MTGKLKERSRDPLSGPDSKFQTERAEGEQTTPYIAKENIAAAKKDSSMLYESSIGEIYRKQEGPRTAQAKSVYNVDLGRYNQMMKACGRVPGMIIKK